VADVLDVLTLAEGKDALALASASSPSDTRLAVYITAVSRRLDGHIGPIVKRTITDEPYDGGRRRIALTPDLHTAPVAVTEVKEYAGTTLTTLTAETISSQVTNQFRYDSRTGLLTRRNSGADAVFVSGSGNILVTYTAGRAADTASVDALFKEAASIMLRTLWRGSASGSDAPDLFTGAKGASAFGIPQFALSPAVTHLIGHLHVPSVA
jgi:hypothetical protein